MGLIFCLLAECLGDAEGMYKPGNWTKQTGPYSC